MAVHQIRLWQTPSRLDEALLFAQPNRLQSGEDRNAEWPSFNGNKVVQRIGIH